VTVTHGASHVSMVQGGTKRLSSRVARVDDAGDVAHLDDPALSPFLDCEVLDINVTGAGSGLPLIDHGDGGLVVDVEHGRVFLFETELL